MGGFPYVMSKKWTPLGPITPLGYYWEHKYKYGVRMSDKVNYIEVCLPTTSRIAGDGNRVRWSIRIEDGAIVNSYNILPPTWAEDKEHYKRVCELSKNRYKRGLL